MPAGTSLTPSRSATPAPAAYPHGSAPVDGITRAQADRIIELLEQRTRHRVDVAQPAVETSQILRVLAGIVLVLGLFGVLAALVTAIAVEFWSGLILGISVVAVTAVNYATLALYYVIAGYIANRS